MKSTNHLDQTIAYTAECHFALCKSCFWNATTFESSDKRQEQIINTCPICLTDHGISLILLAKDKVDNYLF